MVRVFLTFLIFLTFIKADILDDKIKTLVSKKDLELHQKLIKKIFQNKEEYYLSEDKVDMIKIIKTLKDNGLLNLFFKEPKKNIISFKTNSNPLFFIKLVEDNLITLGYYYFLTEEINYNEKYFEWKISFVSESTLDPESFITFLEKRGCKILDIQRKDDTLWEYFINVDNARLDAKKILVNESIKVYKPLSDYWINVEGGKKISIASYGGNRWHPKISVYDKNLHLLKIYKKDKKTDWIVLYLPQNAYYIKISDIFTLNNIKNGLKITLQ